MAKIFVVDDSIGACIAIERILGSAGHDVVWERQGETALMVVEKHVPDLVLCDLVMPDINGYEFCSSVKENPVLHGVPVVLMSGLVDDVVRQRADEIGADLVLPKPFKPDELLELVDTILGTSAVDADGSGHGATIDHSESAAERSESSALDGWEPMMSLLDTELDKLSAFRFAGVIDSTGEIVTTRGQATGQAATLGADFIRLVRRASELVRRLDQRSLEGMSLESDGAVLLLRALPDEHLLVVVLEDRGDLGRARFLLRTVCGLST